MVALMVLAACGRGGDPRSTDGAAPEAGLATAPLRDATLGEIRRAEDQRRAAAIPGHTRRSPDVEIRRAASRALARIADHAAADQLLELLSDEDREVVAWAAYGLGFACKGREESHVRALAARLPTLASTGPAPVDARDPVLPRARAIGRCGGVLAEDVLVSWTRSAGMRSRDGGRVSHAGVVGLGDLASRKKELGEAAVLALLARAEDASPDDMAFYAFSRATVREPLCARVLAAAKASVVRVHDTRILAIKAMSRCGKDAAAELGRVVLSKDLGPAERAEAARGLGTLGEAGRERAASALATLVPDKDPFAISRLAGADFGVLQTLLASLGAEPPRSAEAALRALSTIAAPGEPPPVLARRLAELRCQAGLGLARAAHDAEVLKKCAEPGSYASDRARLAALVRRPLAGERATLWKAFARSEHVRIREAALEAWDGHPELGDGARAAIAEALSSEKAGLVATAAEAIHAHPDRVQVLAEKEKRAALDPRAPPPTANPATELDRGIEKALRAALARQWAPDLFETRMALVDAAVAVNLPGAAAFADAECKDPNVTMREHAVKALRALGGKESECALPEGTPLAIEISQAKVGARKLTFMTDAGELSIRLAPDLAPTTSARISALVASGFYKGIVVHRVVPGFVVQLGDPGGDGFGGSGTPLRCETSAAPFLPLDVGMALSGRDTGSSQIFVTLSRTPHLDGEYTKIGHAEGDWFAVAEGDVIREARVAE